MDLIIYTRRNSGYMKGECNRGVRSRRIRIRDSGGIFDKSKEGIWWRRREISKSSRVKKIGTRKKNDGRICAEV